MATMQSLDIKRYSATTTTSPSVRERSRSPSSSTSPAASAARPARPRAWSGTTCARKSASTSAYYDNPHDLTENTWTLMRFSRGRGADGHLEWLIRKDGCMHCDDPGCLEGLPGAGRDRAVFERHRRLRLRELHRLRLLHQGMSVQHPAHLAEGPQGLQVHAVLRPRRGRPGAGLRQGLPDAGDLLRHQGRHDPLGGRAHRRPQGARLRERRPLRSAGRRRHACDVRAEACRPAGDLREPAEGAEDQRGWSKRGRAGPSRSRSPASASRRSSASCTT